MSSIKLKENQTIWYFNYRFLPPTRGKHIKTIKIGDYFEHTVIEDGTTHTVTIWDAYATLEEALVVHIECLQACIRNKQKDIQRFKTKIDDAIAKGGV